MKLFVRQFCVVLCAFLLTVTGCTNQSSSSSEPETQQEEGRTDPSTVIDEIPAGKEDVAQGEAPNEG